MSHWTRTNSDPITTESYLTVQNAQGEWGRIKIRQTSPGRISMYGCVYKTVTKYDREGTPESEETTVLDAHPTVDGIEVYRQSFAIAAKE